mmetsp:Transcript_16115/g.22253  ORF Transcript_16115/g.22253 Transcript_16115/m.22253 type:complete len:257 (+) Transcript_16115:219-989(+)|eukprot:CAMPEP_0196582562 /NCGR_PEP_ID=MMETSP1081-20130531/39498_1 /TAXON_ID=36882 /ORGANISM="Pyramimonas amylifera, Strain CCMP720" /LENGTH=256 /DNA_ID=CAMNT_0041903167 /DNA_START=124 /DNA_END=894 /DNA_ORIENTATION=-
MSSTLRNSIKRKTHKERSQPLARKKFGHLERHKDYVLRAQDFHKKEKTIKTLREKAEFRNPDEFYFAMQNSRTKGGVHVASEQESLKYTAEELKLMKTQDASYASYKAQVDCKKAERLKTSLHFIGLPSQNKHTIFVEGRSAAASFDAAAHFNTAPSLLTRAFNRPRLHQLQDPLISQSPNADALKLSKTLDSKRLASYRELQSRLDRGKKMTGLAQDMDMQKQLMGKGRKRKMKVKNDDNDEKAITYKWKMQRKT